MKTYFYFFVIFILLSGCNNGSGEQKPGSNENSVPGQSEVEPNITPDGPSATAEILYPSIPYEKLKFIYDNCDFIDYIYHTLPISMSLDEKSSIQNTLTQVAQLPATVNPNCGASGTARMFFQSKGDQIAEAEMFFTDQCKYFVFYEEGKPVYSNQMTDKGIDYLTNLFRQIQTEIVNNSI